MQNNLPSGYRVVKKLGQGCFGEVWLAIHVASGAEFAVKVIYLASLTPPLDKCLTREIKILSSLSNPYIVSLRETHQTGSHYYLVMEYCAGMNLQEYMRSINRPVDESLVQKWTEQLVCGLKEMLEKKVIHRDLKLANVMMTDEKAENADLKVCDFGFSRFLENGELAETVLGTPISTAPEVLNGQPYDYKADVWSLGCMLYELLTNQRPFPAKSLHDLIEMQKVPVTFPQNGVSLSARALVLQMMSYNPSKRPDANAILSHPFIVGPPALDIDNGAISTYPFDIQIENVIDYVESKPEKSGRVRGSLLHFCWEKLNKLSHGQSASSSPRLMALCREQMERVMEKRAELKNYWNTDSELLAKEAEAQLLRYPWWAGDEQYLRNVAVLLEPCRRSALADECRELCHSYFRR